MKLDIFNRVQELGRRDAVLALTTARYPRDTQKIVPRFKDQGAGGLALTGSRL